MDDLAKTVLRRYLWLPVILALLLFLPAGTFRFWQGWVFSGIFFLCTLVTTLYMLKRDPELLRRRLRAGPRAETRTSQKIIIAWLQAAWFGMFVVAGFDHRFGWSMVPAVVVLAADAAVVAGFAITFRVLRDNRYAAATIQVEREQRVITTGTYRFVRHPMYAGGLLMILGTGPALGSLWALIPGMLACPAMIARILDEERYLKDHLPGYREYCKTLRYRLIPFIW